MDDVFSRIEITGVTCDSRRVEPGFVFAALPGTQADGRAFIKDAVAKGASAIIVPDDGESLPDIEVPVVRDLDPRRRYARLAAQFYAKQPAHIAAVTGTNGKTSVAWFARQLLNSAGLASASAGTLGILGTSAEGETLIDLPGALTTPDPADLHQSLSDLKTSGVDHLVIEASSHGLDQRRLDGVEISVSAFTNLSRDHLDYHKTEDAYLAAKLRLFDTLLLDGGRAVVNTDARFADAFAGAAQRRGMAVTRVGQNDDCQLRILSIEPHASGLDLKCSIEGAEIAVTLPLIGAFQASNALVALGVVMAMGVDVELAAQGLSKLQAAPGRMQFCGQHAKGGGVFVDYAHTPDALETVLLAMRPHTSARLHVVFGCGGDRDAGKRPEMGAIATALADHVIVTDDNPRSEDAADIRKQILAAAPGAVEIGSRHEAIRAGIQAMAEGDILVIAGKGHESGQIVGDTVHPFDDASEAIKALEEASA